MADSTAADLKMWEAVKRRLKVELESESTSVNMLPQLIREMRTVQAEIDALRPAKAAPRSRALRQPKGVVSLDEAKSRRASRQSAAAPESAATARKR